MQRLLGGYVLLWLALLLAIAVLVPYHHTDALVFGSWSLRIAEQGTLHTDGVVNALLHRPLFYGVQGGLWHLFGMHEWIGRVWAWSLLVLLVAATWRLGARFAVGAAAAGVAAVLLLAIPDVAVQAVAGQTDLPIAALVAAVAAVLWTVPPSPWRSAALVALTAGAALTKPSAFPALGGLLLAATLVGPRAELGARLRRDVAPVVAGVVLALVYDVSQAAYLDQSLTSFMTGELENAAEAADSRETFAAVYAEGRRTVVLTGQWLGPYLAVLLLYAGLYGAGRVAGAPHRQTALAALPVAVVLSWLLPYLGQVGDRTLLVGPLDTGRPGSAIGFVALLGVLWLFTRAPEDALPDTGTLARLLLWAAPAVLAWIVQAPSETRYVAPAWVPLVLLMTVVVVGAARAGALRGRWLPAAVLLVPLLLGVLNLRNVDGLGARPDGTVSLARALGDLDVDDLGHPERMRAVGDPQLAGLVAGTREAAGADGAVRTDDGRMVFFFGPRATVAPTTGCADAEGFAAVALLGNTTLALPDLAGCGRAVVAVPGSHTVYAIR